MKSFFLAFLLVLCTAFVGATNVSVNPVTVLPSDIDFGAQKTIAIGTDGFPRMLAMDVDDSDTIYTLRFIQCLNSTCTNKITNVVYRSDTNTDISTGCLSIAPTGTFALSLASDGTARIAVQGNLGDCTGIGDRGNGFIVCTDVSCLSSLFFFVAGDGYDEQALAVATDQVGGTTYILYDYVRFPTNCEDDSTCKQGLKIASCTSGGGCISNPVISEISDIDCLNVSSLNIDSTGSPKFAYMDNLCLVGPPDVHYVSGASDVLLASDGFSFLDMSLAPDDTARIAWTTNEGGFAANGIEYAQCTSPTCDAHTGTTFVTAYPFDGSISVATGADGFPRILGSYAFEATIFPGQSFVIQCKNSSCSNSATRILVPTSGQYQLIGARGSLAMSGIGTETENIIGELNFPSSVTGSNTVYMQVPEKVPAPPKSVSRKIIDLIGLNPGVTIPVRSKDGKIPFSFTLIEAPIALTNSVNQSQLNTQMGGVPSPSLVVYVPIYPAVPATPPLPAYTQMIADTTADAPPAFTIGTDATGFNSGWFFIDSSYVSHFFGVNGTTSPTVTTDGSGLTLAATGSTSVVCRAAPCPTVTDTGGNVLANSNNVDPTYAGVVASFTDPTNVKLTATAYGTPSQTVVYTDTMGLTVLTAQETGAGSVPPNGVLPTNAYSYTDASGKTQSFVVLYDKFYQSTNFGCAGISEMPRTPVYLPIKVTLPDGSSYSITYEPSTGSDVTGRIASVRGPTGGLTRYVYGGGNNGINCADGSVPELRTTTPDGGTWVSTHTLN